MASYLEAMTPSNQAAMDLHQGFATWLSTPPAFALANSGSYLLFTRFYFSV